MSATIHQIDYTADDVAMRGTLLLPADALGPLPGVLVYPEVFGPTAHVQERAHRMAAAGYAAFVCDLHGGAKVHETLEGALGTMHALRGDPARIRARARGALEALAGRPEVDETRIAAIGFCFGGTMALELARSGAATVATVALHATLTTERPDDARAIRGRVLACIGSNDPMIDAAQRTAFEDEMRRGNVSWELQVFGGAVHSFTNPHVDAAGRPDMLRYDPIADHRAWNSTMSLLQDEFTK